MAKATLWHCHNTRSLRPLWALEELGLDYELIELPFPPRYLEKSYLEQNVLGTVPYFTDGELKLTESTAICQYLAERYGDGRLSVALDHSDYGNYLNWLHHSDATLTFPQTIYLRYAQFERPERRNQQIALDYKRWFLARLKRLEQTVQSREYLCADKFTVADIAIVYALYLGKLLRFSDEYPDVILAYMQRHLARPAFKKSMSLSTPSELFPN